MRLKYELKYYYNNHDQNIHFDMSAKKLTLLL